MNKERQQDKHDPLIGFDEYGNKSPIFFSSQNSIGNSVMTGLISGQSMPYLKNSESEIKSRFFKAEWESKSKSEPKIFEDFDF